MNFAEAWSRPPGTRGQPSSGGAPAARAAEGELLMQAIRLEMLKSLKKLNRRGRGAGSDSESDDERDPLGGKTGRVFMGVA